MKNHSLPRPRQRLKSRRTECLQVLGWYVLAVLLMQCLVSLPASLQSGRHTHADAQSGGLQPALLARWVHGITDAVHSHDGYEHRHGADTDNVQPLGEEQDAGTALQLLASAPWPALVVWALPVTAERFRPAVGWRFSSRSCAVPLRPPRPTGMALPTLRG